MNILCLPDQHDTTGIPAEAETEYLPTQRRFVASFIISAHVSFLLTMFQVVDIMRPRLRFGIEVSFACSSICAPIEGIRVFLKRSTLTTEVFSIRKVLNVMLTFCMTLMWPHQNAVGS